MSAYDALAGSYDALMADGAHRRRADALDRRFRRSRPPVETVLDLGCGTGTIACLLAARGYRVVAVDGSEDMLAQAARKAEGLDHPPLFLHQDMPRLRLLEPVDAAISTLDSLNYLTRKIRHLYLLSLLAFLMPLKDQKPSHPHLRKVTLYLQFFCYLN